MFLKRKTKTSTNPNLQIINKFKNEIDRADAIIIGAGSGLSTAAGMGVGGERFDKYFFDLKKKFNIKDMYSGGFYDYPDSESYWAFWSRNIWINRYMPAPKDTYEKLFDLVKDNNYFVITTNVDHQFQKAGFDKQRLFYTQGGYGLFQKKNDAEHTYDNYDLIRSMIESQGFKIEEDNSLSFVTEEIKSEVSSDLAKQAEDYVLNLRVDDSFVEDEGWHQAASRYNSFIQEHSKDKVLYLELGVGMNTPAIIKYPFWKLTLNNPKARFVTIDAQNVMYPKEIIDQSWALKADIDYLLEIVNK